MWDFALLNTNAKIVYLLKSLVYANSSFNSDFDIHIKKSRVLCKAILDDTGVDLSVDYYDYLDIAERRFDKIRIALLDAFKSDNCVAMRGKIWFFSDVYRYVINHDFDDDSIKLLNLFESSIYWRKLDRRIESEELDILFNRLNFFLKEHIELNDEPEYSSVESFVHSKRPWGNKDIEASIAFNLDWDRERRLYRDDLPKIMRAEADKLYTLVKNKFEEKVA